jgi:hypothetical protein
MHHKNNRLPVLAKRIVGHGTDRPGKILTFDANDNRDHSKQVELNH